MFSFKKLDRIEKEKENVSFLQVFFLAGDKIYPKSVEKLKICTRYDSTIGIVSKTNQIDQQACQSWPRRVCRRRSS